MVMLLLGRFAVLLWKCVQDPYTVCYTGHHGSGVHITFMDERTAFFAVLFEKVGTKWRPVSCATNQAEVTQRMLHEGYLKKKIWMSDKKFPEVWFLKNEKYFSKNIQHKIKPQLHRSLTMVWSLRSWKKKRQK